MCCLTLIGQKNWSTPGGQKTGHQADLALEGGHLSYNTGMTLMATIGFFTLRSWYNMINHPYNYGLWLYLYYIYMWYSLYILLWMGQRNPINQLIGGKHPIIYRVSTIQGGAGLLPPTVCLSLYLSIYLSIYIYIHTLVHESAPQVWCVILQNKLHWVKSNHEYSRV